MMEIWPQKNNRNNKSQFIEKRPVGPLVARRAWNRLFSLDCVTDCSNSSSCWERLASSDSKTSTCKNTTRNLCSLSRSRHVQQHWEGNRLGLVRVCWKWHRPDHEPLRRVTAGAAAVRKHSSERDGEREAVFPSDRVMSTSTHHTQTP